MARNPSTNKVIMEIEASIPSGIVEGIAVDGTVVGGLSPLSETLWRDRTSTEFVGDVSARLTWKDLTVMVTLGSGETQNVLEGLTGYAEPGTLTALMGPSGSGKSTLLDALSSRLAANAFLSGTVLLNGRKTKLSFGTAVSIQAVSLLVSFLLCLLLHIYICWGFLLPMRNGGVHDHCSKEAKHTDTIFNVVRLIAYIHGRDQYY
jgi:hypothetical protein